jgi:hypothetical protein
MPARIEIQHVVVVRHQHAHRQSELDGAVPCSPPDSVAMV